MESNPREKGKVELNQGQPVEADVLPPGDRGGVSGREIHRQLRGGAASAVRPEVADEAHLGL